MAAMDSIASKFAEYEYTIKLLTAKLEETAAELERVRAESDAHSTLQSIYRNPASSESNRIKAAQAALTVEKPRLAMTAYAGKDVTDEVIIPLADLIRRRRARVKALEGLPPGHPRHLEWVGRDGSDFTDSAGNSSADNGGNGSNDDTAG
jgi:hypothetical protein